MVKVRFNYADVSIIRIKDKAKIKAHVQTIFAEEGKSLALINYIFCSDKYLLEINQSFLKHDFYTDIVTFDLSEKGEGVTGEIYISVDRVKENAEVHNSTFLGEMLRVIFHGSLHLCGYKDKTKSEITIMREKEDYYLRLFEQN
ncbi:MAG TPA: rRNA maturation RNase YbeY [Segetibacter sp.]|jgi:rRNA maturation RNase YbeY